MRGDLCGLTVESGGQRPGVGARLELSLLAGPVATLISSIALARMLGPDGRGVVASYMLWAQILAWWVSLSADKGFINVSQRLTDQARSEVWRSTIWLMRRLLAACGLVGLLFALFEFADPLLRAAFVASTLSTLVFEFVTAWLLAAGRWGLYSNLRVLQPLVYSGSVVVAYMLPLALPKSNLILLVGLAHVTSLGIAVVGTALVARIPLLVKGRGSPVKPILRFGLAYQLTSLSSQIANRGDLLMLSILASNATVGVYSVATAPSAALVTLASAGAIRGLTRTDQRWRVYVIWLALGSVGVAAVTPVLIPILFGNDFRASVLPAVIITASVALAYPAQRMAVRLATDGRVIASSIGFVFQFGAVLLFVAFSQTAMAAALGVTLGRVLCVGFLTYASSRTKRRGG